MADHEGIETPSASIVEVALKVPLQRTFDYRVAPEAAGAVVPGSRVVVPFGTRPRSGIVVGLKAESDVPAERLKTVERVSESAPLFSGALLRFTRWVAEYYFCGWGEVLDAALPSGMGVRFRVRYYLKPQAAADGLDALSAPARDLAAAGHWDARQWARAGTTAADERWLMRQLRPGGLVGVSYEYAGTKRRAPRETWVRRTPAGRRHEPPPKPPQRRNRQAQVLRVLSEEGDVPMARLKALMPQPGAVVKRLAAQGLVERYERAALPRVPGGSDDAGADAAPAGPAPSLNPAQQAAADAVVGALQGGVYSGFLLEGVTGSGKTEVYLHAVAEALRLGKTALVLVPEIALTESIVGRFRARFGRQVAVLHSGMGEGERFDEWSRIRQGGARIVIGARSAVFAPLEHLGLVVVDEEHDGSYKQDETPRYHGRDAALMRAYQGGAVAVLGSATPSMESLRNVEQGKLRRLELPQRVAGRTLPEVTLLNLAAEPRVQGTTLFTRRLAEALRNTLQAGLQAIVFLNRRGFAHLARCTACREPVLCAHCSITLTYHHSERRLRCHRCDYTQALPRTCPACGAEAMEVAGIGTERIEQEVGMLFPGARVLRMDSDSLRRRGELERMMRAIRQRRYDVIIGTQVLSKGHDFPHIALVAAVLADVSLNLPDFRAPERTFQLLTQMAGRAGRGETPGEVLVQTYNPEHYSLRHVRTHDVASFAAEELAIRRSAGVPPYAGMALLWASSTEPARAQALAQAAARLCREVAPAGVSVLGPAEGPIRKLAGRYRWMILLKGPAAAPLRHTLQRVVERPELKVGAKDRLVADIDPYSLL